MTAAAHALERYDWARIAQQLDAEGWAPLPALFSAAQVRALTQAFDAPDAASQTQALAHQGERRSLNGALPAALDGLAPALHARLAPLAQSWSQRLGRVAASLPLGLADAPLLHRLREDEAHPLTHEMDDAAFPLRLVALLSDPGQDFSGGEFVMTEQRPRQQSRPLVLPLGLGDAALIAAAHRPIRGAQGDYRATLRHAISRVRGGMRMGLELPLNSPR